MSEPLERTPVWTHRALLGLALAFVALQLATVATPGYGYFNDEFYYLACAKRLAFGYVDHPPFAPWVLAITRTLLGDSVLGIRIVPALSGGAVVLLTGLLARRLGAPPPGQLAAALCVVCTPMTLLFSSFFSMNGFGLLYWTGFCYLLVRLIQSGDTRWWLAIGVLSGFALLNKHAYALLLTSFGVALLATPLRRQLLEPRMWTGLALAFIIVAPNLWWQVAHEWPSLEFYGSLVETGTAASPLLIIANQFNVTAAGALIWLPGLLFFLHSEDGRRYRIFGIAYLVGLALLMALSHQRPDRLAGFYPVLFAGGATWLSMQARRSAWRRRVFHGFVAAQLVIGIASWPMVLPLLPPKQLAEYPLNQTRPDVTGDPGGGPIPLQHAHRTGWENLIDEVVRIHAGLGDEGEGAVILASDFGQAGALEILGPERGLPAVFSPHMTYALWAETEAKGTPPVVIAVGFDPHDLEAHFAQVEHVGVHDCPHCMRWRNGAPVHIARGPRRPLREIIAALRSFGEPPWKTVVRERMQRE